MPDIAAFRRIEEGSRALVAGELGGGRFASGELEEVAWVRWMTEMAVEPPLVKGHVDERSDRSVVVRECLPGNVESVHARMENRCRKLVIVSGEKKKRHPQTWACTWLAARARREKREKVSMFGIV